MQQSLLQHLPSLREQLASQAHSDKRIKLETSFQQFIFEFWDEVPGAGQLQWNWHMEMFASELQIIAERVFNKQPRLYDLICNQPPGTSKSTIASILFPAWTWTRFPGARHICASHTETLVLDLAAKSRYVITSEKYQSYWPVELRSDQSTKSYFANTAGGDRLSCTVGGKSPTGFHAHFLTCLPGHIQINTNQGLLSIADIVTKELPVQILGYEHGGNKYSFQQINSYQCNPGKSLCRIHFE